MTPLTRTLCSPRVNPAPARFRTRREIERDYAAARRIAQKHKGAQSSRRAALAAELDALTLHAIGAGALL